MQSKSPIIWLVLLVFLVSCAPRQKVPVIQIATIDKREFQIPAGVDSAVAIRSKMKAERLFVDTKREKQADSLNQYFNEYRKITEELYGLLEKKKDEFRQIREEFREHTQSIDGQSSLSLQERRKYEKMFEQIAEDSFTISIVTSLLDYYLDYCSENFDRAYELNPFDLNILLSKSICDLDRGLIFSDTAAYRRAISTLFHILNHNKGAAPIYLEIGKNYLRLNDWKKAHEYLSRANQIYLITSYFENPKPDTLEKLKRANIPFHVNPNEYFHYLREKGWAEIKVYEADSALSTLHKAMCIAPSKQDSLEIAKWIKEMILWDDKNIFAAEQRFIIFDSLARGNFQWAKSAMLRLLPQLKTKKARDYITWQLARIEMSNLNEPEVAADRLYNLVIQADTSQIKRSIAVPPADSMYKVYFKDCGALLFRLGNKYRDEGFQEKAKQFFVKDTTFDWPGRGKVFLRLAQLLTLDIPENLPPVERLRLLNDKRLALLYRAKDFIPSFTEAEIDNLYLSLSMIYQQQRDQVMLQRNFREWHEIKARMKKGASE